MDYNKRRIHARVENVGVSDGQRSKDCDLPSALFFRGSLPPCAVSCNSLKGNQQEIGRDTTLEINSVDNKGEFECSLPTSRYKVLDEPYSTNPSFQHLNDIFISSRGSICIHYPVHTLQAANTVMNQVSKARR